MTPATASIVTGTAALAWTVLGSLVILGHRRTRFPEIVLLTGMAQIFYAILLWTAALHAPAPWYVNFAGAILVPIGLIASALSHLYYRYTHEDDDA